MLRAMIGMGQSWKCVKMGKVCMNDESLIGAHVCLCPHAVMKEVLMMFMYE